MKETRSVRATSGMDNKTANLVYNLYFYRVTRNGGVEGIAMINSTFNVTRLSQGVYNVLAS